MSDLREGFEAWALSRGLSTIRYAIGDTQGVGDYQDDYTSDAWAAWQASRQRDGTAEIAGTVAGLKALDDEHLRSPFNACSLKSRCIQTADALDRQRDGHAEFVLHKCGWSEEDGDSGAWATGCGNLFQFIDGGPAENGFKHCCYCGHEIEPEALCDVELAKEQP